MSVLEQLRLSGLDERIRREMRNREIYTPPISTFRWWARRSHILFGSIVEAAQAALGRSLLIVDPFAGGGTSILEAVRRGHRAYGQDINPWAVRGMRAMLSLMHVAPEQFEDAVGRLAESVVPTVKRAYYVHGAWTTHAFRVASFSCPRCSSKVWLYPYALLSLATRRTDEDTAWFGCRRCGAVTKGSRAHGVRCHGCGEALGSAEVYLPNRQARCPECGFTAKVSTIAAEQRLQYEIVMVERALDGKRWLEPVTPADIQAAQEWPDTHLPAGDISDGKETAVLLRHGFRQWRDLYPRRQRAVLTELLDAIRTLRADETVKEILYVAAVGTAEMAGLASRWDRFYLKAYEVTANHRFAFVPFTAEPNIWGDETSGRGTFVRRVRQLRRSLTWFRRQQRLAEGLGRSLGGEVSIVEGPSQKMALPDASAHLILTDPPYYGDVQYGELSSIFRAWLGAPTGPLPHEVVVDSRGKNGDAYAALLRSVLAEGHRVLRKDGRLILTFHNRTPRAYQALAEALHGAGFGVITWRWVASENERDFAKRDKTACTMDLLLECAPLPVPQVQPPPPPDENDVEAHFLWMAGQLLAGVTNGGISVDMDRVLRDHPFLKETKP
ncbi:MAG: hypothetical protein IMX02_13430 [Limnochordaceae bacterium]|nr:hypothetical protein [Limnochordaceae bacterium]